MVLVFDIVKNGRNKPQFKTLRFDKKGGVIGRSDRCDYKLTDPQNYISGKHLYIEFYNNRFYIRDDSTNGTFLKNPYKKIAKGVSCEINSSDIYIVGDHELQARFDNEDISDYIVGHSVLEPEPKAAIDKLIPDDDFLFGDEAEYQSILTGKKEESTSVNVINLVESKSIIPPLDMDDELEEVYTEEDDSFEDLQMSLPLHTQLSEHIIIPTIQEPKQYNLEPATQLNMPTSKVVQVIEEKLGIDFSTKTPLEVDRICLEVVETAFRAMDGFKHLIDIHDKTTKELFGSSVSSIAFKEWKSNRDYFCNLNANEYVNQAIHKLNTHLLAINGAAKWSIDGVLQEFEPQKIEIKMEIDKPKDLKTMLPRTVVMWQYYTKMFQDTDKLKDALSKNFYLEYQKIESLVQMSNLASAK